MTTNTKAIAKNYGTFEAESVAEERKFLTSDGDFYKWQDGDNTVRIGPPVAGRKSPYIKIQQHYFDDVPGQDGIVVLTCSGPGCRACALANKLKGSGNPVDREMGMRSSKKLRVMCAALVRGQEDLGMQILAFGKQVFDALLDLRANPTTGGDYTDPTDGGFDIVVKKTGVKRDTKYTVTAARENTPLSTDADEANAWLDAIPDLSRFEVPTSDDVVAEKLGALLDDSPPPPRRGAQAPKEKEAQVVSTRTALPATAAGGRKPRAQDDMEG